MRNSLIIIIFHRLLSPFIFLSPSPPVPRKVLKDVYDSASEQDEPDQMELDANMDPDELYDDDQFYRENEAIPPAPKLQGDHSRPRGTLPPTSNTIPASSVPTTVEAPHQRRDENLEGKFLRFIFFHFFFFFIGQATYKALKTFPRNLTSPVPSI